MKFKLLKLITTDTAGALVIILLDVKYGIGSALVACMAIAWGFLVALIMDGKQ